MNMQFLVLPINENHSLLNELKRECIKDSFFQMVENMMQHINIELQSELNPVDDAPLYMGVISKFAPIADKIILNCLVNYINVQGDMLRVIYAIQGNVFPSTIQIPYFYSSQLLECFQKHLVMSDEESDSVSRIINQHVYKMIECMCMTNHQNFNPIFVELVGRLYDYTSKINLGYYKFELDPYYRPMLIFNTREEMRETSCYQ